LDNQRVLLGLKEKHPDYPEMLIMTMVRWNPNRILNEQPKLRDGFIDQKTPSLFSGYAFCLVPSFSVRVSIFDQ